MENDGKGRIWPKRHDLDEYLLNTPEHKQRYDLALSFVEDLVCADVACGAGYGSYMLSMSAKNVVGFDIAEEALNRGHSLFYYKPDDLIFHENR